jgi:hypothetical protein
VQLVNPNPIDRPKKAQFGMWTTGGAVKTIYVKTKGVVSGSSREELRAGIKIIHEVVFNLLDFQVEVR